ncbi:hypothetical protein GJU43_15000 [Flavobacterium sp. LC2016-23]|uniref:hypothetical protein n=1 Tax=Flavobacterium sp. LC2016-23 TaxID=2666330 RepID=UPI0012AFDBD1|nr:hypothetical protein [Flavobacterium sp. LC2016-23]MRX40594.1 hypothetical protein [Flavobacterium sp. LC2016-23]
MNKATKIQMEWIEVGFEPSSWEDGGWIPFEFLPDNFDIGCLDGKHYKENDVVKTMVRPKALQGLEYLYTWIEKEKWQVVDTWDDDRKIIVWDGDEQAFEAVCEFGPIGEMNYADTLARAKLIAFAPKMYRELVNIFEKYDKGTDTYKRLEKIIKQITL